MSTTIKSICRKCCGNAFGRVPKDQRISCKYPNWLSCGGMLICDGFKAIEKKKKGDKTNADLL